MPAIDAVHLLIYTDDAPATRAFLRDVLGFPYVSDPGSSADGVTHGDERDWLIFGTGPSELGVHPTVSEWKGQTYTSPRHHQIAFMCTDLDATMADLAARGARFAGEVSRAEYGASVMLVVPGADPVMLYQPTHPTAYQRSR